MVSAVERDKALQIGLKHKDWKKIFKEEPEARAVQSDMLRMIDFRAMIKAM